MNSGTSKPGNWVDTDLKKALFAGVLSVCFFFGSGCSGSPQRVPVGSSVGVLRAEGMTYRTAAGETLQSIARDRGCDLIVLESLNPRWRGIAIPPGSQVRLPVGKPKVRRVTERSEGTR